MNRREFLAAGSSIGFGSLSGCSESPSTQPITGQTRTTTGSNLPVSQTSTSVETETPEVQFEIRNASISVNRPEIAETVLVSEPVNLQFTLENVGKRSGQSTISLSVDGIERATKRAELDAGQERRHYHTFTFEEAGMHSLSINGEELAEIEVTAPLEHDRLIGTHYCAWYGVGTFATWTDETPDDPVLGEYESQNREIINQHIKWCVEHGINWLSINWYGQNQVDLIIREDIFEAELADQININIMLDTNILNYDSHFDVDKEEYRQRLRSDIEYIADTYFDRSPYLWRDGRPVLYVYSAARLRGDVEAAFSAIEDEIGQELFLIAELPPGLAPNAFPVYQAADVITPYNPYVPRPDIEEVFLEHTRKAYDMWAFGTSNDDTEVLPTAIPGYNDTKITHTNRPDHPILEPTLSRFADTTDLVRSYMDGLDGAFVTSFNEWFENTQIEPTTEYGTAYLEIASDRLARGQMDQPKFQGTDVMLQFGTTVPESELNPDVEDGRLLSFYCHSMKFLDETGSEIVSFDIGTSGGEPLFGKGFYGREPGGENTSRWFGGIPPHTLFLVQENLENAEALVLRGWPATSMEVELLLDGELRGESMLDEDETNHSISL